MFEDAVKEIEEIEKVKPFTIEDAAEEKACTLCEFEKTCAVLAYVNKLSIKRDGKIVNDNFSCSIFEEIE